MGKDISFKNHDRFIHLGIAIAALRKMRGMSQEQLAEKAGISRSLISAIEAPVHTAAASGRWCGAERPLCGLSNSRH